MGQGHAAHAVGQALEEVLPAVGGGAPDVRVVVQLAQQELHDAVEQLLLARDVAVERHRLDPEPLAQAPHGEAGQPELVDVREGRGQDPVAVQGHPLGGGGLPAHGGQVGVLLVHVASCPWSAAWSRTARPVVRAEASRAGVGTWGEHRASRIVNGSLTT